MENRAVRFLKIMLSIIAALVLGITLGALTAVSATDTEEARVIEMKTGYSYTFTPDGYYINEGEKIPHSGDYVLYGAADRDIKFTSNDGEPITYNVIMHNLKAVAYEWYGIFGVDDGVTVNLTVYGTNELFGDNHPGISKNSSHEGAPAPVVNIDAADGSNITIGYHYYLTEACISPDVVLNLADNIDSSVDMGYTDWRKVSNITFSKGELGGHVASFKYVDEQSCLYSCDSCDLIQLEPTEHSWVTSKLDSSDSDYATKHRVVCEHCGYESERADHALTYKTYSSAHYQWCEGCEYQTSLEEHTIDENGVCPVCEKEIACILTKEGKDSYYTSFDDAVVSANGAEKATITLLRDTTFQGPDVYTDLTLELNGYELQSIYDRIYVFEKLTVNDSSESQSGRLVSGGDVSYAIQACGDSSLVINGGEIFGLVYSSGGADNPVSIEINGGRFIGEEKFRISGGTTLTVNGGVYENPVCVFDFWSTKNITLIINGGTFINSKLFIVENEEQLDGILGEANECDIVLVSENGTVIEPQALTEKYDGVLVAAHSDFVQKNDENGHWLECQGCQEASNKQSHSYDYAPLDDGEYHSVICKHCDYQAPNGAHIGGELTCTDKAKCEYCGVSYGDEPKGHVYDNACDKQCNVCYKPRVASKHEYDNDCDNTCNTCGDEREAGHTYGTDGKCTVCKELDPAYKPSEDNGEKNNEGDNKASNEAGNGLGTGAIIGIVSGAVVLLLGLGVIVFWLISKRRLHIE